MIKLAEGFNKHITMVGFKNVHINNIDQILNSARKMSDTAAIQFFDAKLIAGWQHLYFAALNALKAFKNQTNISKNLAVECLLYACAQRQIRVALSVIGIKQSSSEIAVLIITDEKGAAEKASEEVTRLVLGERDDTVLELTDEKIVRVKRLFGISEKELATKSEDHGEMEALSDLVIEHIALLVTQR